MTRSCFLQCVAWVAFTTVSLFANVSFAGLITLQNGTGTFTQDGGYSPSQAIDGDFSSNNGWAIAGGTRQNQTAVWETAADLDASALEIKMYFLHGNPYHLMGRFRFSVTSDDRTSFADGLSNSGDVSANWSVLTNAVVTGPAGMTFSVLGDSSVLPGGTISQQGVYTISYTNAISGVTGFRLESLIDPSIVDSSGFVTNGFASNGNFLLNELTIDNVSSANVVPEPSSLAVFGIGACIAGLGVARRRRRDKQQVARV